MLIFDTETTGLPKPGLQLTDQPRIIELGLIKVTPELEEVARFHSLLNPGEPLEPIITEITSLIDADLADAPTFARVVNDLADFVRGEKEIIAHNVSFDQAMLVSELRRIDWQYRFPFPTIWIDTVPLSGGRKLNNWSKDLLGDAYTPQSHRAIGDCERLLACYRAHRAARERNQQVIAS